MGAKIKTVKDNFPSMIKTIELLNGRKVEVGCFYGEHAWLASIHEYGCKIPVTPKMRAYLHSIGLHLKKSTTVITIPERSFLRAGYDEKKDEVLKKVEILVPDVVEGKMSVEQFCSMVGIMLSTQIKKYARDLKDPPNSSFTAGQKGSNNPLVDTGDMINGIGYRKV